MARREGVWLVEGRWLSGTDREWGVILDHGPFPTRSEAHGTARVLAEQAGGGHLYRAVRYVPAPQPKPKKGPRR